MRELFNIVVSKTALKGTAPFSPTIVVCHWLSQCHTSQGDSPRRRGIFLLEMGVAGVLLLAFAMLCVKYFAVSAIQRRTLDQRQSAQMEASNIMERLFARPPSATGLASATHELTPEAISNISLSPEIQAILPGGELKIDLADDDQNVATKRITVTIRWRDRGGAWVRPVRLAAWRRQ
jgi:hypothetical protein